MQTPGNTLCNAGFQSLVVKHPILTGWENQTDLILHMVFTELNFQHKLL